MFEDDEKVTLQVKNVSAVVRELFNTACRGGGLDRGDVLNELMYRYVEDRYGVASAKSMTELEVEHRKKKSVEKSSAVKLSNTFEDSGDIRDDETPDLSCD